MPAQMMAKNNKGNNKPKVEYNKKFDKKENKKNDKFDKKNDKKFNEKKKNKNVVYKNYKKGKQNKPAVVVVNKPAPKPIAPPPAPVKVVYKNNPVNAVASAVGLVALAAIIAN